MTTISVRDAFTGACERHRRQRNVFKLICLAASIYCAASYYAEGNKAAAFAWGIIALNNISDCLEGAAKWLGRETA
jgi:hypothetical protein